MALLKLRADASALLPSPELKDDGRRSSDLATPGSRPLLKLLSVPCPELDRFSFRLCFSSFKASAVSAISCQFRKIDISFSLNIFLNTLMTLNIGKGYFG